MHLELELVAAFLEKRDMCPGSSSKPCVSVIIPMYNSEAYIASCLESIFNTSYDRDKVEVIVVDNKSTDGGASIVARYGALLVRSEAGTIAKVRNAKGEILAFIDSDCQIPPAWIQNGVSVLSRADVGAAGAGYRVPPDAATWVEKAWLYEVQGAEDVVKFVPSGNMLVKRDLFDLIGGFGEALVTCEDADLCERVTRKGFKVINSSSLQSIHLRNPKTALEFFKKEKWYGHNTAVSVSNLNLDKVFLFTVVFCLLHLLLLLSLQNTTISLAALSSIVILVNVSVMYRVSKSKKYSHYHFLLLLYYLYFWARGLGMAGYALKRLKGNPNET